MSPRVRRLAVPSRLPRAVRVLRDRPLRGLPRRLKDRLYAGRRRRPTSAAARRRCSRHPRTWSGCVAPDPHLHRRGGLPDDARGAARRGRVGPARGLGPRPRRWRAHADEAAALLARVRRRCWRCARGDEGARGEAQREGDRQEPGGEARRVTAPEATVAPARRARAARARPTCSWCPSSRREGGLARRAVEVLPRRGLASARDAGTCATDVGVRPRRIRSCAAGAPAVVRVASGLSGRAARAGSLPRLGRRWTMEAISDDVRREGSASPNPT